MHENLLPFRQRIRRLKQQTHRRPSESRCVLQQAQPASTSKPTFTYTKCVGSSARKIAFAFSSAATATFNSPHGSQVSSGSPLLGSFKKCTMQIPCKRPEGRRSVISRRRLYNSSKRMRATFLVSRFDHKPFVPAGCLAQSQNCCCPCSSHMRGARCECISLLCNRSIGAGRLWP